MAEEVTMSASEKKKEDWMNSKWRPMMGWMYMAICTADFMLFPILWSLAQTLLKQPITQWQPLTLQGAGLFHVAMGAVLGISAMGRTQEKLAGANNGGLSSSTGISPTSSFTTPSFGATSTMPTPMARPMPAAMPMSTPTSVSTFNTTAQVPLGLDPSDPPTRNTRND
jgi:hypothetical protein